MSPVNGVATEADRRYMAAAIRLSRCHVGLTGSNPSVGVLIVAQHNGHEPKIVGRGVTAKGGRPHGEVLALQEAGEAARGATAYVTLEPCAHHGVTPPCADALVRAGIARVVVALQDPDMRVDGRGFAILQAGGVSVTLGVEAEAAKEPLSGFFSRVQHARPYVTLKVAQSADGAIGRAGTGQVAISGAIANRQTHLQRAFSDAILVGVGTVLADDPQLTCRLPGLEDRSPLRIVYDPLLATPPGCKLVRTAKQTPTLLAVSAEVGEAAKAPYLAAGCRLLDINDRQDFAGFFASLASLGISTVLYEAGHRLGQAILSAGLADRLIVVRSPVIVGAEGVASPLTNAHLQHYSLTEQNFFGDDVWCEYERRDR
ncbi:bifunctional diaminohydroxyphosphoribosylaminopyrimidine deaminase/5-amino-6-(5-phosphoribosylamino)uracil reductase RibD [Aureimonas fodinaquatilis]|uniref:Riboflavin biosynthesis protein RibD n=1 Tax=Aureimonas fodinaquatilis TaxID=2565783 RepID=A0A5B0DWR3_9HYPH|nr:bifunctional diaminohydroxyphosphoribosylaminopyrimidine deaminase/5-amino-6-(5-phosphoribosylamino)uracil reductase RibD [Aureimonas fodinaquatilis]KAA0970251.1 bifunctional diaminohydroxyphosphoribosylaminopyrimidine deaminase/5-amino-6-(5-phosphoribosylamino)uracil reductase RibD [Aureimonas fodinaquatilis]